MIENLCTWHRNNSNLSTLLVKLGFRSKGNFTVTKPQRICTKHFLSPTAECGGFALAFGDLLYVWEVAALVSSGLAAFGLGLWLGELKLLSRDLQNSDLSGVVFGGYRHLNRVRHQIAMRLRAIRAAELSQSRRIKA